MLKVELKSDNGPGSPMMEKGERGLIIMVWLTFSLKILLPRPMGTLLYMTGTLLYMGTLKTHSL